MKRKAKRIIQQPPKAPQDNPKNKGSNLAGYGVNVPPDRFVVHIYFDQKGLADCADVFLAEKELLQWKTGTGSPIRNWKVCAADWIFDHRQRMKRRSRLSPYCSESI
ncbi:hypothetical protein [Mucilaginibacter flavidus]|uniref:hypothetical protein n=1 Tax=Mucilaginibacter flavidus TaxID=2949309 RepID=UPI002092B5FD|nr:hypothetical protein [Mucilaginibacter flavidus]MCO5950909.1 hypothetical protein [Mucilaginibacter flavidus]